MPVLFDPVLVMNYPGAKKEKTPEWVTRFQSVATLGNNAQLEMLTHGIRGYLNTDDHQYVHFVDGGITDNLGLRAIHDIIEMAGGMNQFFDKENGRKAPRHIPQTVHAVLFAWTAASACQMGEWKQKACLSGHRNQKRNKTPA